MKKKSGTKLLVHVGDGLAQLTEIKKALKAANKALYLATNIHPDISPDNSPLNLIKSINDYLKGSITIPIELDKAAGLIGKESQYKDLLRLSDELRGNRPLTKYIDHVELVNGEYTLSSSLKPVLDEAHSIYLTKPAEIALYKQVEVVIKEWQKAIRMSRLTGETHLGWRLASAFNLVTMDGNTKPIPNYHMVKELSGSEIAEIKSSKLN